MMRSILVIILLGLWGKGFSQQAGFAFSYTGPTQILVGPNCVAPLDWGHPNTPTAASNLPGGFIVSFDIYSITLGYEIGDLIPGGTTITVFYQALDNYGNTALFGFNIAFVDNTPPTFDPITLPPALVTVPCHTLIPPPAEVEATDNCENDNAFLTVTFSESGSAAPCTGGTITRTWIADDGLGNSASFSQTINVLPDNTPPFITNNLQNGSAPCATAMAQYTTWLNTQRANFTATDNGCGIMSLSDNAPSPATITSFCGVIEVLFTAIDNCNNISTELRTFTVTNTVAPQIITPASDAFGDCSQSNIATVFNNWINSHGGAEADDDCSAIIWSTSPSNPSLSSVSCDSALTVLFIAGDGCNNFDTTSATFALTDNTPPNFTTVPMTSVVGCSTAGLDSLLNDWLTKHGHSAANDLCTSSANLVKGYRLNGMEAMLEQVLQAWQDSLVSGCADDVFIGGIGLNNVLAYLPVEFTYTDNCGNTAGRIGVFGITDNGRPTFTTMPSDTALSCSQGGEWQDVFMSWYESAGGATWLDQCSGAAIMQNITADSALQYLAAALDTACGQGAGVTITFTLVDGCGNTSLDQPQATFSLQDTVPPVIITPAEDLAISCSGTSGDALHNWLDNVGEAEATDGCGSLHWTFAWQDTSGAIVTGIPGEGPYPEPGGFDCSAGLEVIFTAYDICQNSVSDTAYFSVNDTIPPVIQLSADTITFDCPDTLSIEFPVVMDDCDPEPLITFIDSISTDSCLGLPVWVIRTWTATDQCGNSAAAMQWFFRGDTTPPTFDLPADTVAFCSIDTLILLQVVDNCDPNPQVTWIDETSGESCQQVLMRTWIVTDACGNSTTATQEFDLSDETGPVIIQSPGHFVYACDTTYAGLADAYAQWQMEVEISDGCSDAFWFIAQRGSYDAADTMTWPGTPLPDTISATCEVDLLIEADLVAYDACGNVTVEEISFSLTDTTAPEFVNCPGSMDVQPDPVTCEAVVTLTIPDYTELCFPENVELFLSINEGELIAFDTLLSIDTLLPTGIHIAQWMVRDCKGNEGVCTIEIYVTDEDALQISCPSDTIMYSGVEECAAKASVFPPQTSTSGCSGGILALYGFVEGEAAPSEFTFDSTSTPVDIVFAVGSHQVYLIAIDSTGDHDTCTYMVTVLDTISPALACSNDTIYLHPAGLDTIDVATLGLWNITGDACGIDTITYDPQYIHCGLSGSDVVVEVTATDIHGNTAACNAVVTILMLPVEPDWERGLCDDTLRLFANLPLGPDSVLYTFTWTGPNGFESDEENPVIPDADSTYSGVYHLVVTSSNGCSTEGSTEVVITALSSPVINLPGDTICTGTEIAFTTQSFSGGAVYSWYIIIPLGDTVVYTTDEPELLYIPEEAGAYQLFASVAEDSCQSEPGPVVEFFAAESPTAQIASLPAFLCLGDTLYLAPVDIIDSLEYIWTGSGGFMFEGPTPPGIAASELDTISQFFLTAQNVLCKSIPDSVVVQVQYPPTTPEIAGDTIACEGGAVQLYTQGSYHEYHWINPEGEVITSDADTLLIAPVSSAHHGEWHVVAFLNGCISDTSASFHIQIDTGIQVTIEAPTSLCVGDELVLSVTPDVSGDYVWTGPGGFTSNEISPVTEAVSGTYSVMIESGTGCQAFDEILIETDERPMITDLVTDAVACANGVDPVTLWVTSDPPYMPEYEFRWTGPVSFEAQDSSAIILAATSAASGTYTVHIRNGACISDTASIVLELQDSPPPPVITGDTIYCFAETIVLEIDNPIPDATYTWSTTQEIFVVESPGTLTVVGALPNNSDIYQVVVTVGECTSAISQVNVTVMGQIAPPAILSPAMYCEGDSLILISNAPPGSMSHWIGPNGFDSTDDQPVIFPAMPIHSGTYQVLYLINGCSSPPSNPFELEVQPAIAAPVLVADVTSVCIDQASQINLCLEAGSLVEGGVYTWILNATEFLSQDLPDSCITITSDQLAAGENTITAFASVRGCVSEESAHVLITGDAIPEVVADAGPDAMYCPGEIILLEGLDTSPATGIWSTDDAAVNFSDPFDPQSEIIDLPAGTYELEWTLSYASCTDFSSDIVTLTIFDVPVTLPDTIRVPFNQTVEFDVTANDQAAGNFNFALVTNPARGNTLHAGNGILRYTPNIGYIGQDALVYRLCSVECPDQCSESTVILLVGDEDDCFVPTLFTPNNDGINDYLVIPCLEAQRYPQNKIMVFNEWGDAVFTASPYQNNWDGTVSDQSLPVGTYFYILDFGDGSTPKRSFLILER